MFSGDAAIEMSTKTSHAGIAYFFFFFLKYEVYLFETANNIMQLLLKNRIYNLIEN